MTPLPLARQYFERKKTMRYFLSILFSLGLATAAGQELTSLSDDFSDASSLNNWTFLHDVEKWPNKLNKAEVKDGYLVLEPRTSGWFNDGNAPFVFKNVTGDFDVRARVKASGITSDIPSEQWSLGGLMVRIPRRQTAENWTPNRDTWMFMTTGIAEMTGKPVLETKYTINSRSNLKLRDARADWITLRVVRVGHAFIMLYKYDTDTTWTVHERFYFQQWPPTLQVGFNCYTSSKKVSKQGDEIEFNKLVHDNEGPLDMRLSIDFIQFKKPAVSFSGKNMMEDWYNNVYKNRLTDYSTTNEELLKLLGA